MPPPLQVFAGSDDLMRAAAEEVVRCYGAAVADRSRFVLALSGGSTPSRLYALLASPAWAARIDWSRVHVFWGDERCVPPDDTASNYRMARIALLDHVPIPPTQIHRMRGEDEPMQAATAYEAEMRRVLDTSPFDLVLLGLGPDGHTASLFPGTAAVHERERWAVAHYVPAQSSWRITLTPVVINAAVEIVFLVTGADKAPALQRVLEGPLQPDVLPAQTVLSGASNVRWLVDSAAAARVNPTARTR